MKPLHTHWRTREGELLAPAEMDTTHLINALNMCIRVTRRTLLEQAEQLLEDAYSNARCREYALEAWPVTRLMEEEVLRRRAAVAPPQPSPLLDLIRSFPDGAEVHRDDWPDVEKLVSAGRVRWISGPRGPERAWRRVAA